MSYRKEPHYSSVETNELPDKVESAHLCLPHVETVLSGRAFALQAQDPEFHPQLSSWKRMYCVCIYIYMHHNLQKLKQLKSILLQPIAYGVHTSHTLWNIHQFLSLFMPMHFALRSAEIHYRTEIIFRKQKHTGPDGIAKRCGVFCLCVLLLSVCFLCKTFGLLSSP